MTTGQKHDKAIKLWSIPFALVVGSFLGVRIGILAGISFLLGGLWLSPDLDISSKPLKRWGFLKILWWPYRKFIPHRSIFSHGPFLGTALRIIYLIIIAIVLKILLLTSGIEVSYISIDHLRHLSGKYTEEILAIIGGIEASVWLHLFKDGDPFPSEWNKSKK